MHKFIGAALLTTTLLVGSSPLWATGVSNANDVPLGHSAVPNVLSISSTKELFTDKYIQNKLDVLDDIYKDGKYWTASYYTGEIEVFTRADFISDKPCKHSDSTEEWLSTDCCYWLWEAQPGESIRYDSTGEVGAVNLLGYQCAGFGAMLSDRVFGTKAPYVWYNNPDKVKLGDCLRVDNANHTIFVTGINRDADCLYYVD